MASAHPKETLNLVLRKATRLWEFPWNDYQQRFLRFAPAASHVWWHDAIVIAGLSGLLIFLCTGLDRSIPASRRFIGTAGTLAIIGHGVYVLFAANARYGFTAMPFLVLFAAYALYRLAQRRVLIAPLAAMCSAAALIAVCRTGIVAFLPGSRTGNPPIALALELAICVALVAVAFLSAERTIRALAPINGLRLAPRIILVAAGLLSLAMVTAIQTSDRKPREWTSVLRPGQIALRRVALPPPKAPGARPSWAFVLFDSDSSSTTARVAVDGTVLADQARTLHSLTVRESPDDYYTLFAGLLRVPPERLRQWRVVPLPASLLNNRQAVTISCEPGSTSSTRLYGDFPVYFSPTKLVHQPSALEGRTPMVIHPARSGACRLHTATGDSADLSSSPGHQFGQYRLFILTGFSFDKNGQPDLSAARIRLM
jgi:hypothetical protein